MRGLQNWNNANSEKRIIKVHILIANNIKLAYFSIFCFNARIICKDIFMPPPFYTSRKAIMQIDLRCNLSYVFDKHHYYRKLCINSIMEINLIEGWLKMNSNSFFFAFLKVHSIKIIFMSCHFKLLYFLFHLKAFYLQRAFLLFLHVNA